MIWTCVRGVPVPLITNCSPTTTCVVASVQRGGTVVAVAVGTGVFVAVLVAVGTGVAVLVAVGAGVLVAVLVAVGVKVGATTKMPPTTWAGSNMPPASLPWQAIYWTPGPVKVIAKVKMPVSSTAATPITCPPTRIWTVVFAAAVPLSSN